MQLVGTDEEEAGSMPGSNDEILHHLNSSVEGLQLGNDAEREKLVADDHNSPIHFRETHIATQGELTNLKGKNIFLCLYRMVCDYFAFLLYNRSF